MLSDQMWRLEQCLAPLERALEQIESGDLLFANDRAVIVMPDNARAADFALAVEGIVDAFENATRRLGLPFDGRPLSGLAGSLSKEGVTASDITQARRSLAEMRGLAFQIPLAVMIDVVKGVTIRDLMEDIQPCSVVPQDPVSAYAIEPAGG